MVAVSAYLFQGFIHNVPSCCYFFLLADSVYAVQCLVFYHGVPLRFHEEDMVRSGQIQPSNVSDNVTAFGQLLHSIRLAGS